MHGRLLPLSSNYQPDAFLKVTHRVSKYHNPVSLCIYITMYKYIAKYICKQQSVKQTERQQSHVDIIQSYTELIKQAINLCITKGPQYHTRTDQAINFMNNATASRQFKYTYSIIYSLYTEQLTFK